MKMNKIYGLFVVLALLVLGMTGTALASVISTTDDYWFDRVKVDGITVDLDDKTVAVEAGQAPLPFRRQ